MNYGLIDILTLIGALGLFLYGMKLMSESLQKVAGDRMRNILGKMTSNRFKGLVTGFLVTCGIQSSSATTVMVVSFVNAGLLSLAGAIGIIMGANIGTTITAWIITLFGFKVKMSVLALPLIAIVLPLFFSKKNKRKSWAEFVLGFAILFIGLEFLKESVPDIKNNPEILSFLQHYTDLGYGSVLIFVAIGTLLTIIIQSSSATMALTLVMCNEGWLPVDAAAAMVLGENIGTTITANLAAMIANVSAKRAARAHFIFNVFGVLWMLAVFPFFLEAVIGGVKLFYSSVLGETKATNEVTPEILSTFHSCFNIINTIILIWFVKFIEKIVVRIVRNKEADEEYRLQFIETGLTSTAELSLVQAKQEIVVYANRSIREFTFVREMFNETSDKNYDKLFEKIKKYEDIIDRMEVEIANYLTKISEGEISMSASRKIRAMLKVITEIESISDSGYNIAITINRQKESKQSFSKELCDNINHMFSLVEDALNIMYQNLENEYDRIKIDGAQLAETRVNEFRDKLREKHVENIKSDKYDYQTGIYYNDIYSESEKLADYIINVSEAIRDSNVGS